MPIERMTAMKVNISDIINGRWVQKEGMEPSFVTTQYGMNVSRTRILGTIVAKFLAEDGNFASMTIDDSSETIRAKTFKTTKPLDSFNVGDLVDLVGKVREYNGEIYVIPEVVRKITPNEELLRRLEILSIKKNRKPEVIPAGEIVNTNEAEEQPKVETNIPKTEQKPVEKKGIDKDTLRKEIIKIVEAEKEGIQYTEISKKVNASEEMVESIVNDILSEGICYEPSPGKIRKI
ncbi:MAG: hypothetical protein ISS36_03095 [Candidatus Aenigmarchaeota archaeon]|nr:hypothetical protein [Candidatus Aenigmarchaeota archaeon]